MHTTHNDSGRSGCVADSHPSVQFAVRSCSRGIASSLPTYNLQPCSVQTNPKYAALDSDERDGFGYSAGAAQSSAGSQQQQSSRYGGGSGGGNYSNQGGNRYSEGNRRSEPSRGGGGQGQRQEQGGSRQGQGQGGYEGGSFLQRGRNADVGNDNWRGGGQGGSPQGQHDRAPPPAQNTRNIPGRADDQRQLGYGNVGDRSVGNDYSNRAPPPAQNTRNIPGRDGGIPGRDGGYDGYGQGNQRQQERPPVVVMNTRNIPGREGGIPGRDGFDDRGAQQQQQQRAVAPPRQGIPGRYVRVRANVLRCWCMFTLVCWRQAGAVPIVTACACACGSRCLTLTTPQCTSVASRTAHCHCGGTTIIHCMAFVYAYACVYAEHQLAPMISNSTLRARRTSPGKEYLGRNNSNSNSSGHQPHHHQSSTIAIFLHETRWRHSKGSRWKTGSVIKIAATQTRRPTSDPSTGETTAVTPESSREPPETLHARSMVAHPRP